MGWESGEGLCHGVRIGTLENWPGGGGGGVGGGGEAWIMD